MNLAALEMVRLRGVREARREIPTANLSADSTQQNHKAGDIIGVQNRWKEDEQSN